MMNTLQLIQSKDSTMEQYYQQQHKSPIIRTMQICLIIMLSIVLIICFISLPKPDPMSQSITNTLLNIKQTLQNKYFCQQYVIISKQPLQLQQFVKYLTVQQIKQQTKNKLNIKQIDYLRQKASKRCGIIQLKHFTTKIIKYNSLQYIVIQMERKSNLARRIQSAIKNEKNIEVHWQNINNAQYAIIHYKKCISIAENGYYSGSDSLTVKKLNAFYYKQLNDQLIQFYKKQNAKSIVDFGCGLCQYAANLKEAKFEVEAYDGNPFAKQLTNGLAQTLDLVIQQDLHRKYDWVQSFGVAQHIPSSKTNIFIQNLMKHANKGILMSWGVRGQAGQGHVNTKNNYQVINLFKAQGFIYDQKLTEKFRQLASIRSLKNSLMAFRRSTKQSQQIIQKQKQEAKVYNKQAEFQKIIKILTGKYKCKLIYVISSEQNSKTMLFKNITQIQQWVSQNHTEVQKQKLIESAEDKCAIITQDQFKSQIILYTGYQYVAINSNKITQISKKLQNMIYQKGLQNSIKIYQENIKQKQVPFFHYIKTQKLLSKQDMQKKYSRFKSQILNPQNIGKPFGKDPRFTINLGYFDKINNGFDYDAHGIYDRIQVAGNYDFANISKKVDFVKLEEDLANSISHQLITFKQDPKLQKIPSLEPITEQQQKQFRNYGKQLKNIDSLNFITQMLSSSNNNNIYQKQYYYYDEKYQIGSIKQESSVCVYSSGYNIFTKGTYKLFFESLEKQNYTNFHIVYVDDTSPDQSAYKIFDYLNQTNSRLTNRIKIVHTLQHLGSLGNMFFWIQKYCDEGDIVAVIDADDSAIGKQTLKVLNAVYRQKDYWYVYTNYVGMSYIRNSPIYRKGGSSMNFIGSISTYRVFELMWYTSHMKTFKKLLMDVIPIQYFIQYHYNSSTGEAYPSFHGYTQDRFQVYTQLQLAGQDRFTYINDYLYLYDVGIGVSSSNCYREHEYYDEYKARIQTPPQRLNDEKQKYKRVQNYKVPGNVLTSLRNRYYNYAKCKQKFNKL